jgi:signal transduction histidine kinase
MRVIDWLRRRSVEVGWTAFAAANVAAMLVWPRAETVPFHWVWISLTILYGFRVWSPSATGTVLAVVFVATGSALTLDAFEGAQPWDELTEVPLMSVMFIAMVWHARRRQQAMQEVEELADVQASLLERHERFVHDASHELRTPVTIARGHLELLRRGDGASHDLDVALDELERIERIVERLLLLAEADRPDFVVPQPFELDAFLEDVFLRWSEVAPRAWRLGELAHGTLAADQAAVRTALDALLENAVKYTDAGAAITLRSRVEPGGVVSIEVADEGIGVPPDALELIFDRFARADAARTRAHGGVGLGLAIVDAIAKGHGGRCSVRTSPSGSVFSLHVPRFQAAVRQPPARVPLAT